jgi:vacuolar-type H+-ATPase subunit H
MNKILVSILFCTLLISCNTQTISEQKKEILGLREMNALATAEYTITKVVKANDNQTWFKVGDRKILLSCTGTIKAGIDLSQLTENDVIINKKELSLQLQPAKIISLSIPPELIKLEFQQVGFWRDKFTNAEQNELLAQAETQIRQVADSIGILKTAQANATQFISNFLKRLGYSAININYLSKK